MATVFTVDTLRISKRLREGGLKKETAEILADELKGIGEQSVDGLATKNDIRLIRQEIKIAMLTTIISLGSIMTILQYFFK